MATNFPELCVGEYTATEKFRAIERHACVCVFGAADLIAVTGPTGDSKSSDYACLFAAAPDLLAACEAYLYGRAEGRECEGLMRDAVAKAKGGA